MYGVNTQLHARGPVPEAVSDVDYTGTDLPAQPSSPMNYGRSFRPSEMFGRSATVGTAAPLSAQLADHMTVGKPDPRRGQNTEHAADRSLDAQPEWHSLTRLPSSAPVQAPPTRTRGGWTAEDPHRQGLTIRNLFGRAFDQVIAQSHGVKAMMQQPVASLSSLQPDDAPGALPTGNSGRGARIAGIGPTPDTYRLLPRPWSEGITTPDTSDGAYQAMANQARRGWRR